MRRKLTLAWILPSLTEVQAQDSGIPAVLNELRARRVEVEQLRLKDPRKQYYLRQSACTTW